MNVTNLTDIDQHPTYDLSLLNVWILFFFKPLAYDKGQL